MSGFAGHCKSEAQTHWKTIFPLSNSSLTDSGRHGLQFANDIAGANNGVPQDLAPAPGFKSGCELERAEFGLRCGDPLVFYTDDDA
jgi:hypothetical protein